jgi:hypothetical protein
MKSAQKLPLIARVYRLRRLGQTHRTIASIVGVSRSQIGYLLLTFNEDGSRKDGSTHATISPNPARRDGKDLLITANHFMIACRASTTGPHPEVIIMRPPRPGPISWEDALNLVAWLSVLSGFSDSDILSATREVEKA